MGGGPERDRAARPPELAARLAGKGGARRVSAPVLAARAATPARPEGSCRWACALVLGPEPLFSQCFIKSSTKLENGHQH